MTRITLLTPRFVDYVPDTLESSVLYVAKRFATASHLCCCGCGHEVVTPLNPAKWRLTEYEGSVSLHPSIGNWSLPCRSHYWIDRNTVRWAGVFNPRQIAAVQARDLHDAVRARPTRRPAHFLVAQWARKVWKSILDGWR